MGGRVVLVERRHHQERDDVQDDDSDDQCGQPAEGARLARGSATRLAQGLDNAFVGSSRSLHIEARPAGRAYPSLSSRLRNRLIRR